MTLKQIFYLTRPHTLPASVSPVIVGLLLAVMEGTHYTTPSLWAGVLCVFVATFAQALSNVVNDLADFKKGADVNRNAGFERLLASGRLSYNSVRNVAVGLVILTALLGLFVVALAGNWWLLLVGGVILLGAFMYSSGQYAFAYHGLGEVAVFLFFGWVAMGGTYYVMEGTITLNLVLLASAMGLANVNILLVNNYRDVEEDKASGKRTLAVRYGAELMPLLYSTNILLVTLLIIPYYNRFTIWLMIPFLLESLHLNKGLKHMEGKALNTVLSKTAKGVLLLAISLVAIIAIYNYLPCCNVK